jgi:hypothetical protein
MMTLSLAQSESEYYPATGKENECPTVYITVETETPSTSYGTSDSVTSHSPTVSTTSYGTTTTSHPTNVPGPVPAPPAPIAPSNPQLSTIGNNGIPPAPSGIN